MLITPPVLCTYRNQWEYNTKSFLYPNYKLYWNILTAWALYALTPLFLKCIRNAINSWSVTFKCPLMPFCNFIYMWTRPRNFNTAKIWRLHLGWNERERLVSVKACYLRFRMCCRPVGCLNSTRTKLQKGVSERHKSVKHNPISFHLSKVFAGHLQAIITKPSKQYFALFCKLCNSGLNMQ